MLHNKKITLNLSFRLILLSLVVLVTACSNQPTETDSAAESENTQTLKGKVDYRERIILPKGSTLKVSLVDVSKQDVAGEVVSFMHTQLYKTPPFDFELDYDASKIIPNHSYAIQARIEVSGKLRMVTTEHINPFAENIDSSSLHVPVRAVGLSPARQAMDNPEEKVDEKTEEKAEESSDEDSEAKSDTE